MPKKEQTSAPGGNGRSLIATRTNQQQQRKMQGPRSHLPRSYSSPATAKDESPENASKAFVLRSFSSPEPNKTDKESQRSAESLSRTNPNESQSELDIDLDNFEQFEEGLKDIDAENCDFYNRYRNNPEIEQPKRILTTMLPGSGLQKVALRPVTNEIGTVSAMKQPKKENKRLSRLSFRPLIIKMPSQITAQPECESIPGLEELQTSPQFDIETDVLDHEFDNAEEHLKREIAIAAAETDVDMV
ncbi:unnamed protein product [Danaus chrysippus]|uniref:(African queen) hypothetical protein n=1 Tax=Danaus chrysippus TaxID=151541 RepID=A0A8J2WBB2_9NEOP|nr:unnamed protein product [Danaus chrysippus]